jgi:hypothetical protein
MEAHSMDEYEREMEIIALLSNPDENYKYIKSKTDVVEHACEKTNETRQISLVEVEYFKDAGLTEDKANFCDKCNQVFIYRP